MDVFMSALIKMSLRGVVIILVVLLVRVLLGKLRIGHRYILGLWAMVFLYFIFPWKLSLPVGFWNNAGITDEIRAVSESRPAENESHGATGTAGNSADLLDVPGDTMTAAAAADTKDTAGTVPAIPAESKGQNIAGADGSKEDRLQRSHRQVLGVWETGNGLYL